MPTFLDTLFGNTERRDKGGVATAEKGFGEPAPVKPEVSFTCPICGAGFKSEAALAGHVQAHEKEKQRRLEEEAAKKAAEEQKQLLEEPAAAMPWGTTLEQEQEAERKRVEEARLLEEQRLEEERRLAEPEWKAPVGYEEITPPGGVPTLHIRSEDQYLAGIRDLSARLDITTAFPARDIGAMSPQERRIYRDSLRKAYRNLLHIERDERMGRIPEGWGVAVTEPDLNALQELSGQDLTTMSPAIRKEYLSQLKRVYGWGVEPVPLSEWEQELREFQAGINQGEIEPVPTAYQLEYTTPNGWKLGDDRVTDPEGTEYTLEEAKTIPGVIERLEGEFTEADITEMVDFAEADPEGFVAAIRQAGDTPLTRAVIQRMGLRGWVRTILPEAEVREAPTPGLLDTDAERRELILRRLEEKYGPVPEDRREAFRELISATKPMAEQYEEWETRWAAMVTEPWRGGQPFREWEEEHPLAGGVARMAEPVLWLQPTAKGPIAGKTAIKLVLGALKKGATGEKLVLELVEKGMSNKAATQAVGKATDQFVKEVIKKGKGAFTEVVEEVARVAPKAAEAAPEVAAKLAPEPLVSPAAAKVGEEVAPIIPKVARGGLKATDDVAQHIAFEAPKRPLSEKLGRGWVEFNKKLLDDLYAIRKFRDAAVKAGADIPARADPYITARLLRGWQSKANVWLEKGTMGKEYWDVAEGVTKPKFVGEGLTDILKPVSEGATWQDFATYLTSKHSIELTEYGIKTGIKPALAKASIRELEKMYPVFKGVAEKVHKYNGELLNYAKETGLISDVATKRMQAKYGSYVPFNRVFEELQVKGYMGKAMANITSPVKRIKGSERQIINPLESMVRNTYLIVSAGERNQVGIMMANLVDRNPGLIELFAPIKTPMSKVASVTAKELGLKGEGLSDELVNQAINIFRPSMVAKGNEVTVLIKGKAKFFKVDDDIRDALLALDREQMGTIGRFFSAPTRWLRAGATLSPDFMARNPIRDQMTAFVYSKYGFMPGIDFTKGVADMVGKSDAYWLYRMSGAEHSMLISVDREYLTKTFQQVLKGKPAVEYFKHPIEALRVVSEAGEKGTRLGEFRQALAKGVTPPQAGFASKEVSLDFSRMGTAGKVLNQFIAFFNANVQGWDKLIRAFREQPLKTSFKVFGGITMPSVVLYMVNRGDPRWKEIPQWQKDLFWIIMTEDNIYRIPKPFELGIIFGSVPERFLEWLDERDPALLEETAMNLMEAGSPGFIPTFALPALEWMTNYSFFMGRQIVPESRQKMPPELQYTHYTSESAKKMGEWLKLPPAKIDNWLYAWTAGLGRYTVEAIDGILKGIGIASNIPEPSKELSEMPVIKSFVVRNPIGSSSESVNRFYRTVEQYEQYENHFQELVRLGKISEAERLKTAHPELLLFYDYQYKEFYSKTARALRRIGRNMTEIGRIENQIYDSPDLDSKRKRELIDQCEKEKTRLAKEAMDFLKTWPSP